MKYTFDKLKMLLLAVGVVFVGFIFTWFKLLNVMNPEQNFGTPTPAVISSVPIIVGLYVDPGNGKTTIYNDLETNTGESAYSLLVRKMNETGSTVSAKKYDFGLMVESINGTANSATNFWSYSVNGVAGNVAADKYVLQNGDVVEWKFTKMQ